MNKNILVAFYAILLVLVTGCSKPKDAIDNVFTALQEGDLAELSRNSSLKTTKYFSMSALKKCNINRAEYKDNEMALVNKCFLKVYSDLSITQININVVSDEEADANVTIMLNEEAVKYRWKVFKVEEVWKVFVSS